MFGDSPPPQNEQTPFRPRSPYSAAKVYAYWMVKNYREGYGMFAANGILFNHESPRRGETFVTRKITRALARIKYGLETKLYLGNLEAKRDWGYAPDFVEVMWLMLQQDEPEDYVIATEEPHSVKEFVDLAFNHAGIELEWRGNGVNEKGIVASIDSLVPTAYSIVNQQLKVGGVLIEIDPRYFRPLEVEFLQGDASKAKRNLGWEPRVRFKDLVKIMVDADIKNLEELRQCQDVIRRLSSNRTVGG
jgi:GDPmannose 4,6-dehydratase